MDATVGSAARYDLRPQAWLERRGRKDKFLLACAGGLLLTIGMTLSFDTSAERAALVLLTAPPWIAGILFVRRTGLWIGDGEVLIRGFVRTRKIPLPEARRFVPGVFGWVGNGYPAPGLERVDGKVLPCFSLGREGAVWKFDDYGDELEAVCEALNAILRDLQERAGQAPALSPPLRR